MCFECISVHQRTALYVAAEEGQLDIVKYFIDGRPHMDINSTYNKGVSILCSVASIYCIPEVHFGIHTYTVRAGEGQQHYSMPCMALVMLSV